MKKKSVLIFLFCFFNLHSMNRHQKFDEDCVPCVVKRMIEEIFDNVINEEINLAFLKAADDGELKLVQEYIDHEINVNAKNDDGETALILASKKGYKPIIQALLDAGADKYIKDKSGFNAAYYAFIKLISSKKKKEDQEIFDLVF